jgi:hypothetical protein
MSTPKRTPVVPHDGPGIRRRVEQGGAGLRGSLAAPDQGDRSIWGAELASALLTLLFCSYGKFTNMESLVPKEFVRP